MKATTKPQPTPVKPSEIERLPIASVVQDPANVRKHPERNQESIRASLRRFGPGRSIVLDGKNVVRAGNGTIEQAAGEGFTELLVVEPGPHQLVAVRRPEWSDTEATGYSIADNQIPRLAQDDPNSLAETVATLQTEGIDLSSLGFNQEELNRLVEGFTVPDFQPASIDDQGKLDEKAKVECPNCGHKFTT